MRVPKVVLIEDSAQVRRRLARLLATSFHVDICAEAEDPAGALEAIRKHRPDVAIVDIRLRGGSGIDVIRQIMRENIEIAVVVLTNYTEPQYRQACKEAGAEFFFDKSREYDQVPRALGVIAERLGKGRE